VNIGLNRVDTQTSRLGGAGPTWLTGPTAAPTDEDAQAEEKASLCALKTFVTHACEVLGLWKLLCEHQFHVLAPMLPVVSYCY